MSVDPAEQSKIRTFIGDLVSIVGFVVLASVVLALIAFVITRWNDPEIRKIAADHLQATVGLPIAGVFAVLIVAVFQTAAGPIEFDAPGFTFKGVSGPIIMWLFSFLAIVYSIHLLW